MACQILGSLPLLSAPTQFSMLLAGVVASVLLKQVVRTICLESVSAHATWLHKEKLIPDVDISKGFLQLQWSAVELLFVA